MAWEPIFRLVKRVPKGCVITYGQLARAIKLRGGARAAGYAMAVCPKGPRHSLASRGRSRRTNSIARAASQPAAPPARKRKAWRFRGAAVDMTKHSWNPPAARRRPKKTAIKAQYSSRRIPGNRSPAVELRRCRFLGKKRRRWSDSVGAQFAPGSECAIDKCSP